MEEKKTGRSALLRKLFLSMLSISAFTFGGGFVIVTLMKRRFVDELKWLSEREMLDMTALAQSAPGPIMVNAAVLVGRRMAGAAGAAVCVAGSVLPPIVILSVISRFYAAFADNAWVAALLRGMQAGVAAVIVSVTLDLGGNVLRERDGLGIAVMLLAFCAALALKVNAVLIVLAAAAVGVARALLRRGGRAS